MTCTREAKSLEDGRMFGDQAHRIGVRRRGDVLSDEVVSKGGFSSNGKNNFRLGNPDISFELIVKACRIAGADEFISQLPDKYQTVLGEFGANISGGQRQRLAIARATAVEEQPLAGSCTVTV